MYKSSSRNLQRHAQSSGPTEDELARTTKLTFLATKLQCYASTFEDVLSWIDDRARAPGGLRSQGSKLGVLAESLVRRCQDVEASHHPDSQSFQKLNFDMKKAIESYRSEMSALRAWMIANALWSSMSEPLRHIKFRQEAWVALIRRNREMR